jgi:hypothetical protein
VVQGGRDAGSSLREGRPHKRGYRRLSLSHGGNDGASSAFLFSTVRKREGSHDEADGRNERMSHKKNSLTLVLFRATLDQHAN